MIILGLDPGLGTTGWGVIAKDGNRLSHIDNGEISTDAKLPLANRLVLLDEKLRAVIEHFRPEQAAVEEVFVNKNAQSTLKLGQARGAALAALGGLEPAEYAPRAVKLATVGTGAADKLQVAHMMRALLKVEGRLTADAADALAVALCHAQHRRLAPLQGLALRRVRR